MHHLMPVYQAVDGDASPLSAEAYRDLLQAYFKSNDWIADPKSDPSYQASVRDVRGPIPLIDLEAPRSAVKDGFVAASPEAPPADDAPSRRAQLLEHFKHFARRGEASVGY